MCNIPEMRTLGKERRLQADSDRSVTKPFNLAALELEDDLSFNGRKAKPGPILNAIALWWIAQPQEVRIQIARDGLARLESLLSDATTTTPEAQPSRPSVGVPVAVRDETAMQERTDKARRPPPKRGPRKKG